MKKKICALLMLTSVSAAYAMPAGFYHCPTVDELNAQIINPAVCEVVPDERDRVKCHWQIDPINKDNVLFSAWVTGCGDLYATSFVKTEVFARSSAEFGMVCLYDGSNQSTDDRSIYVWSYAKFDFSNCSVQEDQSIKCG